MSRIPVTVRGTVASLTPDSEGEVYVTFDSGGATYIPAASVLVAPDYIPTSPFTSDMTPAEVETAMTSILPWDAWFYDDLADAEGDTSRVIVVERHGGGEDDGGSMWFVFAIDFEDGRRRYFRRDGHYDSWDSNDWSYDEVHEVYPTEKTVTVYALKDS